MAVTLADVAHVAGVSIATVSRALSGRGELDPRTRARVIAAARDVGYRREDPRGRPREGTARLMDLVLGGFHDPWSDEVVAGAHATASALGYDLVLMTERPTPDDDWPLRIRRRGSAGAILGLIQPTRGQRAVLEEAGIPLVLLDPRAEEATDLLTVRTTDHAGGHDAGRHLVHQGARSFIAVAGLPSYRFGRARIEGFESAVAGTGAWVHRVAAQWTAAAAREAIRPALAAPEALRPVGVFATTDEMAIGVYAAAAEAGLGIPDDVLVVGFDDVRDARRLSPPLTTVRQPIRRMAAEAVRAIDLLVSGGTLDQREIELATTLIPRASTGA